MDKQSTKRGQGSPRKETARPRGEAPRPGGAAKPGAGAAAKPASGGAQRRAPSPRGPREAALNVLLRVDQQGAYSGLELNRVLSAAALSRQDAALATEIVYGTIQRLNTIDRVLKERVKGWPNKVEPWVRSLLRLSYYQLRWLDRVPAHAVTDEAVRIAKKRGHAGIAGLVNGVLRGLVREGLASELPSGLGDAERISLTHSYPEWLVKRWIDVYGAETAEAICEAGNEPPQSSARVNPTRISRSELLERMDEAQIYARPSKLAPGGIVASRAGSLAATDWYREGLLTVQDESSMLVAAVAGPKPGMRVLDCCAAPGGKTTHLAELMGDAGEVVANDIHPHKEALVAEQAARLGLRSIRTVVGDAAGLADTLPAASMDVVLLDAPCSGLGVIRRKPEIKWNKSEEDIAGLAALQAELLEKVHSLVRPGGTLVYSTCTIAKEENEEAILRFLEKHPNYMPDTDWPQEIIESLKQGGALPEPFAGMVQLLPQQFGSDGFFIAKLKRLP
ncbi:16S rRNA (cytosine(967)-C(5))-methyltransferase RsmB [Cohnella fermenti]|uniref:16S rRNA (cytosine(967)-C(5))-methyltransferase n=2 Tax=Cohnella fermenti TaxID=2565925 RepID=A0A4S4BFX4_9BACL|nr:16S rRNA (cytosine(967)-C(5))-methyltransferase RsmB [Cohnella fermenti]THF73275.1 16S rRNA (cytosine(967)-C(5))-methyltransferase RsmB [Cohnella fermenti]